MILLKILLFFCFSLLHAKLVASSTSILTDRHNDIQANKIMAKFLEPAPGESIRFFEGDLRDRKTADALNLRGYITLRPPKGVCFTVTTHRDREDKLVCKETSLSWLAKDLGSDGSIRWKISTGKNDFGRTYVWNSPYRIAQTINLGKGDQHDLNLHVVLNCETVVGPNGNYVKINLHRGRTWKLYFPEKHQRMKIKESSTEDKPKEKPKDSPHEGAKENTKDKEKEASEKVEAVTKHATEIWNIPEVNAYEMNSSYFKTADGTSHDKGSCRYQPKGASQDKEFAWFECHHTASFEVVYSHLSCEIPGF